jgi:hypothetical protein
VMEDGRMVDAFTAAELPSRIDSLHETLGV